MEDEAPTKTLTRWFKNLKNKNTNKILLVYGDTGVGKTYFIENHLTKYFNLKPLTNERMDELKDEKIKNYYSFLSLFFDMITLDDLDAKPKVMIINESKLYNFDKYEQIISKIIDDSIKLDNYPIIVIMTSSHTKFLSDIRKKSTSIFIETPKEDVIKGIISNYLEEKGIVDKITPKVKSGKVSSILVKKMVEMSNGNLNKLNVLLDNLVNNYCDKEITKKILTEFLDDNVENNIKNDIYTSNYELLTNYKSIEDALEIFNHDRTNNPLIMEESYNQKIIAYERCNNSIWKSPYCKVVKRLTKSFTYSNLYDTYIFNSQQWLNLKRIYGYFSCALPSYLLNKIPVEYDPKIEFPSDMNKTSIQRINTKQILNIYEKFDILNIEYYIFIGEYIKKIIEECVGCKNKDKRYWMMIKKINDFVKYYKIDQNTIERILKINKLDPKQIKFTKAIDQIFF